MRTRRIAMRPPRTQSARYLSRRARARFLLPVPIIARGPRNLARAQIYFDIYLNNITFGAFYRKIARDPHRIVCGFSHMREIASGAFFPIEREKIPFFAPEHRCAPPHFAYFDRYRNYIFFRDSAILYSFLRLTGSSMGANCLTKASISALESVPFFLPSSARA